jgi:hypothetical protein
MHCWSIRERQGSPQDSDQRDREEAVQQPLMSGLDRTATGIGMERGELERKGCGNDGIEGVLHTR